MAEAKTAKKSAAKKPIAKATAAKKTTAKAAAKPASSKKAAPKAAVKATAKTSTKTPAKVTPAKKVTAKATSAKAAPAKKTPTKKTPGKAPAKAAAKPAAKAPAKAAAPKATAKATKAAPKVKIAAAKAPAKKTVAKKAAPKALKKGQTVTFRVKRGAQVNGQVQQYDQEFKVKYDPATTVLQGLEQIKGDQDGTLTFRRSCRASICGSCGMFINNRSRLACKTKVRDLVEGNPDKNIAAIEDGIIEISPQKNQPVLKDLVVDIHPFYDKVEDVTPYVQDGNETQTDVGKDAFDQVNLVSNCIMCGSCYSDCTAMVENPNFLGPAALAKAYRFVSDPREGNKTERLQELSEKNGIWDCTRCGMCVDACPKGVAPMEAIVKLRALAIEAGVTNNRGARHAMVFKKDIAEWGVLNEAFMMVKTMGVGGMLGQVGNALNLAKKGKIPHPFPHHHKAEKLDEVKRMYKELDANPIDVETKSDAGGPGAG